MIKLFCDSADFNSIKKNSSNPLIKGWTTNPTLMAKAGIIDYEKFARDTIYYLQENRPDTCLSLEIFADTDHEMMTQARKIHSWSEKYPVYVKIPITDTRGSYSHFMTPLSAEGIKLNITAILTEEQIEYAYKSLNHKVPSIISIFAGRIYDTGVDAAELIRNVTYNFEPPAFSNIEILWASPRQVYDYVLAKNIGCDIITMTPELIAKLKLFDKSLYDYSLETVRMFFEDGVKAGYKI